MNLSDKDYLISGSVQHYFSVTGFVHVSVYRPKIGDGSVQNQFGSKSKHYFL